MLARRSLLAIAMHDGSEYTAGVDRTVHKSTSFADAARWDRAQHQAMTPDQRLAVAKELRDRAYGTDAPDVREAERRKAST